MQDDEDKKEVYMMKKKWIGASVLCIALISAGIVSILSANTEEPGKFWPGHPGGCLGQLTEEQREELNQRIQETIQEYLEEQGIDIEECEMTGPGPGHPGGCLDQLTEEQREELNQLMQELKEEGATPEEIRDAVQEFLEEHGIDTENCDFRGMGGHKGRGQGPGDSS
jgi:coenzyme F420-reducing hydrogenase alpha subunit